LIQYKRVRIFSFISTNQNLTFHVLEEECLSKLKLSTFSTDTLKTLNLYSDENGYNIAALLLSDNNNSPGLDIVIFGSDINEIRQRVTLAGKSLISQYFEALEIFKKQYMFERISNGVREEKEKIPYNAFREALANSLIHRAWDIYANSKVEMYADRIIVSSPGGLVEGITKESFLKGSFSVLRNPIIANVFLRLRIVEILATGIKRINDAYKDSLSKPSFDVMSSAISIALPLYGDMNLNANERKVIDAMAVNRQYRREEIEDLTSLKKDTLIRVLNSLIKKNQILKTGKAKAVIYSRNA
jgi:ATP-dependent DNA helicase RecG